MDLRLNIHANGGYDVVAVVRGKEGKTLEFTGYALTPFEIEAVVERFMAQGADVVDYRTPEKLRLAAQAKEARALLKEMIAASVRGGVDKEALVRCKLYADAKTRAATETSC